MMLEIIVTLEVGLGLSIQICFSKRFNFRREGEMVSADGVMPRMRVWGEFVNKFSKARIRVVMFGLGLCFSCAQERSSRIIMS